MPSRRTGSPEGFGGGGLNSSSSFLANAGSVAARAARLLAQVHPGRAAELPGQERFRQNVADRKSEDEPDADADGVFHERSPK